MVSAEELSKQILIHYMDDNMGRHCKIDEVKENLLKYISIGVPNKYACQAVSIDEHTLYNWIEKGRKAKSGKYFQFFQSYTQARGKFVVSNMAIIEKHAKEKDFRAAAWLLERLHSEEFGKKDNLTADVTVKQVDLVKKWVNELNDRESQEDSAGS